MNWWLQRPRDPSGSPQLMRYTSLHASYAHAVTNARVTNPLPTSLRQEVCSTAVPGRYWLQTGMDHVCLGLCCSCNQLEILLSCLANVICKLCVWGRFALPCLHCLRGWPCIEHAIHVTLTLWNTSPSPCCHTHTLVTMLKSDCSC